MMEKMLARFGKFLREEGFSVPTSVIEEAPIVLSNCNVLDKEEVEMALSQIWIKDMSEKEKFSICFREFFFERYKDHWYDEKAKKINQHVNQEIQSLEGMLQGEYQQQDWLKEELDRRPSNASVLCGKYQKGMISKDVEALLELTDKVTKNDIDKEAEDLMWKAMMEGKTSVVFDSIKQMRYDLHEVLNKVDKIKTEKKEALSGIEKDVHRGERKMISTHADELKNRPMSQLSEKDIEEIQEHLKRSSVHLLTKMSALLQKTKKEDEIDMQKTIAESTRTFGVPFRLQYRTRKQNRTKIHILLDVSGSVIKSAEILSLFSYLVYKQFPRQVKTFSFVGMLDETNHFYATDDIQNGIRRSLQQADIDYRGYSDYGNALSIYQEKFMREVDQDTIVIMLGDARNNRNKTNHHILKECFERARSVCWFNPESISKWNQGDSKMKYYQPYCNLVKETVTTNDLIDGLYELIQTV